jgi:tight adherence protein B
VPDDLMGAFMGLVLGLGLLLVGWSFASPQAGWGGLAAAHARRPLRRLLDEAGMARVTSATLMTWCVGTGLTLCFLLAVVSRSASVAIAFGCMGSYAPIAFVRGRRMRRRELLESQWPDVVDDLTSAVRAGLALPEALVQIGVRGPHQLRPAFAAFSAQYRATGRFADSLDRLKTDLADPVGDRVVEALRVARDVGGHDLGALLRTLSSFLREDNRIRGELRARQAWTVNGARVAVAAPWLVLGMLALRPAAVAAYDTAAGAVVLVGGVLSCALAYTVMLRIGRLPVEPRVFA